MKSINGALKFTGVCKLSAFEIVNKLQKRELKLENVVNEFLIRIKIYNKFLKVFKFFDEKMILDQIKFLKNNKTKSNNLMGIPVAVKDIFNTFCMPNSMGTKIYDQYYPGNDARVVFDIKRNSGLVFGKTYSSEFAVHNPAPTRNPWNLKLSPGTSSSGSAVAVATRMVPISIGTQTAGSIIRPASYCGVIGYKPTFGTISRTGVLKTADTLDTIGFFSNYIEDLQMIFDSTRQKGLNYPITNKKIDKVKSNLKRKKKIGILIGPKTKNANSSLLSSLEKIIKNTKNNNLVFEEYKLSNFFNDAHYFHKVLYTKSLSYYLKNEFKDNQEKLSKSLSNMILYGKELSLSDYQKAIDYQKKLILKLDKIFNKYDFLIDLSTFSSAPNYNSNGIEDHNLIWTMGHIPSISLPIIKDNKGLPVGVQLNSKRYNDYELLEISKFFYEKN